MQAQRFDQLLEQARQEGVISPELWAKLVCDLTNEVHTIASHVTLPKLGRLEFLPAKNHKNQTLWSFWSEQGRVSSDVEHILGWEGLFRVVNPTLDGSPEQDDGILTYTIIGAGISSIMRVQVCAELDSIGHVPTNVKESVKAYREEEVVQLFAAYPQPDPWTYCHTFAEEMRKMAIRYRLKATTIEASASQLVIQNALLLALSRL